MPTCSDQLRIRSRAGAFTLSELLLVVAIIVIVGGLSGGLYTGTHMRLLVEKAARLFLLTAKYARIAAIEQQRPYELQLDEGNRGFMLTITQPNEQTGQTEKFIIRNYYCKPVEFEGEVKFENVQIATLAGAQSADDEQGQRILFMPNGSAESAIVQIGDGKNRYTVAIVAATGKATLYRGGVDEVRTAAVDLDAL